MATAKVLTHPEYDEYSELWEKCRDFIAGEEKVKGAGVRYLPRLESMNDGGYMAYKDRAGFFNATGRTQDGLCGMIFRKAPTITLAASIEPIGKDADLRGSTMNDYAKRVVEEVIGVGRGGTLVDWQNEERRAYLSFYEAEAIWNWRWERVNGRMTLTMVALHECVLVEDEEEDGDGLDDLQYEEVEQLRVCRLKPGKGPKAPLIYTVELWQLKKPDNRKGSKPEWMLEETITPVRNGAPLNFIPFYCHTVKGDGFCCAKPPLLDIISVNLHHYRLSADLNHGLHFTALPTAWVAGFDPKSKLTIGSSVAWVSEKAEATAGYLEFTGQGLGAISGAMEKDEKYMAVLGARLLEEQKLDAETAETLRIRQGGEASILTNVADSISASLTKALKACVWWTGTDATVEGINDEAAQCQLNTDFLSSKMSSADLIAMVDAWQRRAISRKTLHYNLEQGEILPPNTTEEDEQTLIETEAPVLSVVLPPPVEEKTGAGGGK